MRRAIVGVMGSGVDRHEELAAPLGRWIAEGGHHLLTGGGGGVMEAVSEAFAAVPSPSAAARVLLWLDPVARGADLDTVDPAAVLTGSAALAAVVQRALRLV